MNCASALSRLTLRKNSVGPRLFMTTKIRIDDRSFFAVICFFITILITAIAPCESLGQTTNPTDKQTPVALTPGMPTGARIEDYASINLFNGHLAFSLPLAVVGGRGALNVPISLSIERFWQAGIRCDVSSTGQTFCRQYANPAWWGRYQVGYGPGLVEGRSNSAVVYTFKDSTGTEHELRDTLTHGQPNQPQVSFVRGTNFASIDGSSITYISDFVVNDAAPDRNPLMAYGYLLLPNGTQYRIDDGLVRWIRDRNGNKITYDYESYLGGQRVKTITDPLGRTITINYDVNDPVRGLCDQIILPGFGATSRIITITKSALGGALRADQPSSPQTYGQLFPQIQNDINYNTTFNPTIVSGVYLANGQSLKFFYNKYAELGRIQVAEGGAIEFDHLGGITNQPDTGAVISSHIYRRVVTKRVYTNATDPASLTRVTTYSRPETWNSTTGKADSPGYVSTEERAADNTLLSYEKHYFYGVSINSLFSLNPYPTYKESKEYKTEIFGPDQTTVLVRREQEWRQRAPVPWWSSYVASRPFLNINDEPANDPRVVETIETIEPAGANLVSKLTTINPQTGIVGFDENNQTDTWQYDYGVGAPSTYPRRHDHTDYLTVNPANNLNYSGPANGSTYTPSDIHLRGLVRARQTYSVNPANGTETLIAQTETKYEEAAFPLLPYATIVSWVDPGAGRGNPTTIRSWVDITNTWLETHTQYDQCGNVRKTWDLRDTGLANPTQMTYGDAFSDNIARNTFAFPTIVTSSIPDATGQNGSAVALVTTNVYDFNTGRAVSVTDPNGKTTTYDYTDPLNRLKQVTSPDTGRIRYNYSDTPGDLYVQVLTDIDASRAVETRKYFDGLGREFRSFLYDGTAATPWIVSDTYYDAAGRIAKQSRPYRVSSANATLPTTCSNCTTTAYDILSRVVTVTSPDNAQLVTGYGTSTSGVLGITSTVTDPAGRKHRTLIDAVGRVVRVDEPNQATGNLDVGGSSTSYVYDVLGNLRKVTQGTQQQRYFLYDSLGRLLRIKNSEQAAGTLASNLIDGVTGNTQWSTAYSFDNNGNPISRVDARNITTSYAYDALNRLKTRSYDDGTPNVSFFYDATSIANSKGRLTSVSSSVASCSFGEYDSMGRVKASTQTIDGVAYSMSYIYNLAGAMISQIYPSGRVVASEYDEAGRLAGVKNSATGNYYAGGAATDSTNRVQYAPHGEVSQLRLGNTLWEHKNFNSRLQPEQIGLGTASTNASVLQLDYSYGTSTNNGNLQSQTITLPGGVILTQNYTYDQLNRLQFAQETIGGTETWKQGFIYTDQNGQNAHYGNRRLDTANTTPALITENPVFDPASNRILSQTGEQYSYDGPGNLTHDKAGHLLTYDAENRQTAYNGGNPLTGGASYVYDYEGRRVKKLSSSGTSVFVYNVLGQLVAEYSDTQSTTGGTSYLTADMFGTPRIVTNSNAGVIGRHDYLPFGEEVPSSYGGRSVVQGYIATDSLKQKFTSKERDSETGLDFFGARYYSSAQGRFTSVDPSGKSIKPDNPQTWNRYVYAVNNPLMYVDPNGKWPAGTHDKIIDRAFDTMDKSMKQTIQRGSREVDLKGVNPRTLWEANAYQHAMTPGYLVHKYGLKTAQNMARTDAINFVDKNLTSAKSLYDQASQTRSGFEASLLAFGAATHTIMDNWSPAHRDFKVYDNSLYWGVSEAGSYGGALLLYGVDMLAHAKEEEREPTEDEMNNMIDEMRLRFYEVYGPDAYNRAISQEEREKTAERLSLRSLDQMLYCVGGTPRIWH